MIRIENFPFTIANLVSDECWIFGKVFERSLMKHGKEPIRNELIREVVVKRCRQGQKWLSGNGTSTDRNGSGHGSVSVPRTVCNQDKPKNRDWKWLIPADGDGRPGSVRACKRSIVGHSDVKGLSDSRGIKHFGGKRWRGGVFYRSIGIPMVTEGPVNTCSQATRC